MTMQDKYGYAAAIADRVAQLTEDGGQPFSAYTERDGGPWYLIAGHRESWHGAQRIADTDTGNRDKARAFLLHMMGVDTPKHIFTVDRRLSLFWEFVEPDGARFTVWTDEACRAFPQWARSIGMEPRNGWPAPTVEKCETVSGGERLTMSDGTAWFHPFNGGAPIRER